MMSTSIRGAVLAILLGATTPALWALPTLYHLQDLGATSSGEHINASGEVSGIDPRFGLRPAVWIDGVASDLDDKGMGGWAHWVNASGVAAGAIGSSAALWSETGVLTDLGEILGWDHSDVKAINDAGDCTVLRLAADGERSFLLPGCTGANPVDLGSLGGDSTTTVGINARGQIAGTSALENGGYGNRAFLWESGHMRNLGVLPLCIASYARGLSSQGHVAGYCVDRKHKPTGVFWNGRKMAKVGTLGGKHSTALGVNHFDIVVGSAQTSDGTWHPFVLDKGTHGATMRDLTTMLDSSGAGWHLDAALGINNAGRILVRGVVDGDGAERSAILTPVK